MKRFLRNSALAPLVMLVALAVAAPVSANPDAPRPLPQREKLIVGMPGKLLQNGAVLLAKSLGEFEKENLDVEYSIHKPSDSLVLLSTGRLDAVATQPSAAFFNAVAAGNAVKLVAPIGFLAPRNGFWVSRAWLRGRPYAPEMLKGQTIASVAGLGTAAAYAVDVELAKAGLTLRDVSWKSMAMADIVIGLENGAVNVALLLDPAWHKADPGKVAFAFPFPPGIVLGGYLFGPNLLEKRRAVGEAFVRALARTVRTHLQGNYGADPRVVAALAREMQLSEAQVRTSAQSMQFPVDMAIHKDLAALLQKSYLSTPAILTYDKPLPDAQVIDRTFLRATGLDASGK